MTVRRVPVRTQLKPMKDELQINCGSLSTLYRTVSKNCSDVDSSMIVTLFV